MVSVRLGILCSQWEDENNVSFSTATQLLTFSVYRWVKLRKVCILFDYERETTYSDVARLKFFISIFSARDDGEKLMPCKHFTLLLFMFILKLHALKLKNSRI
jgi:hypothetical protein